MTSFTIFPAIDLRGGRVVRLQQGDPARQTLYADDPLAAARRWIDAGAAWLHVVNLDGAFGDADGAAANRRALAGIAALGVPVQFGGGLRSLDDARAAIDAGARRVVLGTVAVERPDVVAQAIAAWGPQAVVAGLDSRDGMIVTRGWQHGTGIMAADLGNAMRELGVRYGLYTEVGRDGMLGGAAAELTAALAQLTGLDVIASGGVGSLKDIDELALYAARGVCGAVVGKALYDGRFTFQDALLRAQAAADDAILPA